MVLVRTQGNTTEELDGDDPEVTPGLFQGDMAMTNEIYNYWRVGLRWDTFPEKLWENGTIPYVISPLYGKSSPYRLNHFLTTTILQ